MSKMYLSALAGFVDEQHDWVADDIRVLLVTSSYVFDETDDFVSEVSASELSGGGYARVALANKTVTESGTHHRVSFDADDAVFTALQAAAGTPSAAVVFLHTGNDATAKLIAYCSFSTTPAPNGGNYTVKWNSAGVFTLAN